MDQPARQLVVDASVALAADSKTEACAEASRQFLQLMARGTAHVAVMTEPLEAEWRQRDKPTNPSAWALPLTASSSPIDWSSAPRTRAPLIEVVELVVRTPTLVAPVTVSVAIVLLLSVCVPVSVATVASIASVRSAVRSPPPVRPVLVETSRVAATPAVPLEAAADPIELKRTLEKLRKEMQAAAERLDFEKAAQFRDQIRALKQANVALG